MIARIFTVLSLALLSAGGAKAQGTPEMPMPPMSQPVEAHKWLHQFEGEWTTTMLAPGQTLEDAGDAAPKGTMSFKMLGELWLINNVFGNMGGGVTVNAILTIGYDESKKKYIGSWVDSFMNIMWLYEGTVDESGKKLSLEADGPNMMGGEGTIRYRDSYEFKSDDHIVLTSEAQMDGTWTTYVTADIRRKK